jgi:hypothetical protein
MLELDAWKQIWMDLVYAGQTGKYSAIDVKRSVPNDRCYRSSINELLLYCMPYA